MEHNLVPGCQALASGDKQHIKQGLLTGNEHLKSYEEGCQKSQSNNNLKIWGWAGRSVAHPAEALKLKQINKKAYQGAGAGKGTGGSSITYMETHNHVKFQYQGIQCLLAAVAPRHAHTYKNYPFTIFATLSKFPHLKIVFST